MKIKATRKISNIPRSPAPKERIHDTLESAEEKKIQFSERFKQWQEARNHKTITAVKKRTHKKGGAGGGGDSSSGLPRSSSKSQNLGSLRTSQVLSGRSNDETAAAEEVNTLKKHIQKVVKKRNVEQLQPRVKEPPAPTQEEPLKLESIVDNSESKVTLYSIKMVDQLRTLKDPHLPELLLTPRDRLMFIGSSTHGLRQE